MSMISRTIGRMNHIWKIEGIFYVECGYKAKLGSIYPVLVRCWPNKGLFLELHCHLVLNVCSAPNVDHMADDFAPLALMLEFLEMLTLLVLDLF